MKEFKTEQEHIDFLKPIISRLRIYIQAYENISKTELLEILSKRMNKQAKQLHLKQLTDFQLTCDIIDELKNWKKEICGIRNIQPKVNLRQLAKKQRGERKMKVVELFNSIDGEGKRAGELTTFIRLYGCNLRLSDIVIVYMLVDLKKKINYLIKR